MNPTLGRSLIKRFAHLKVLVIGDLMLDHFLWGSVTRISPRPPFPVVDVSRETEMPGGAGNVALNMAALGARCLWRGWSARTRRGTLALAFQRWSGGLPHG